MKVPIGPFILVTNENKHKKRNIFNILGYLGKNFQFILTHIKFTLINNTYAKADTNRRIHIV